MTGSVQTGLEVRLASGRAHATVGIGPGEHGKPVQRATISWAHRNPSDVLWTVGGARRAGPCRQPVAGVTMECPRFGGQLSAWSALSGWAGRMLRHAKGIELQEAVPVGVPA